MNNTSAIIESQMKDAATLLAKIGANATFIGKAYFATGANTPIGALETDGTAATKLTKLTKGEFVGGITFANQVIAFLGDAAVSTGDYTVTSMNLINGSDEAVSIISNDVEDIGLRLKDLGNDCLTLKALCDDIVSRYFASELSSAIGAISSTTVIFGCSTTKQLLSDGINLVDQFLNLMTSDSVTTGDYQSTLSKWVLE